MLCCLSLKPWLKKLAKGRSPTMRHVSRNHRVALDWLCVRLNLDSQIQIRYIYTKHQLADISTKGKFTRDEWNNLLQWFSISHFSYLLRWEFQLDKLPYNVGEEDAGTKRRRKCGEIEIYSDDLVFTCSDKFHIRKKSECIPKSSDTHGYGENLKAGWEEIQNPTQRRVLKRDCKKMHTLAGWWNKRGVRGCGLFRIWNWETGCQ